MSHYVDDLKLTVYRGTHGRIKVRLQTPGSILTGYPSTVMEPAFEKMLHGREEFSADFEEWTEPQVSWLIRQLDDQDFQAIH